MPLDEFAHESTIYLQLSAQDSAGLTSGCSSAAYMVDKKAPAVREPQATYADGQVLLTWIGNDEADLSGYQIYRKAAQDAKFSLLGNVAAVPGQIGYRCSDSSLPKEAVRYTYQIEAVDKNGNTARVQLAELDLPDRSLTIYYAPFADLNCQTVMTVNGSYLFDASASNDDTGIVSYTFDFGDGTTASGRQVQHTYTATGEYTVTLTVTDTDGIDLNDPENHHIIQFNLTLTYGGVEIKAGSLSWNPITGKFPGGNTLRYDSTGNSGGDGTLDMQVLITSGYELADLVGTGCVIYLDGEAFTAVVRGDVNGDARIDIFDLYNMLQYFNSEGTLNGAYLEAGKVLGSEDVDIFDIYAELEYINTGAFTQERRENR